MEAEDIYYSLSTIRDPEHQEYTLCDLEVVTLNRIQILENNNAHNKQQTIQITLVPTSPRCSLMSLIGLSVLYVLDGVLPKHLEHTFRVQVLVAPNTHQQWEELTKQFNDKERVAAALESPEILHQLKR
eukprot:PhF_6_TR43670/c0_g1_i3/m.67110